MRYSILILYFFCFGAVAYHSVVASEEDYLELTKHSKYNISSVKFITINNVKYNKEKKTKDIILALIHRFNIVNKYENFIQNLGPNGTAIKKLFITSPKSVEHSTGFYVYDIYFKDIEKQLFFDVKAPYSKIKIALARYGSFSYDTVFARNINKLWNIGISFGGLVSQREFLENSSLEDSDRIGNSNQLSIFSHFSTDDDKYELFINGSWMAHSVREPGGIVIASIFNDKKDDREHVESVYLNQKDHKLNNIFLYNLLDNSYKDDSLRHPNSKYYFNSPKTFDIRKVLNVYHQFFFLEELGLYHDLEFGFIKNVFEYRNREKDNSYSVPEDVGKHRELQTLAKENKNVKFNKIALGLYGCGEIDYIQDVYLHSYLKNELGLKLKFFKILFMPYYLIKINKFKNNNYELNAKEYASSKKQNDENIFGLYSDRSVGLFADDLISGKFQYALSKRYLMTFLYENKHFKIAFHNSRISPSALALYNNKYWRKWNNHGKFVDQFYTQYGFNTCFSTEFVELKPNFTFHRIKNFVFFKKKENVEEKYFKKYIKSRYDEIYSIDPQDAKILVDSTIKKNLIAIAEPAQAKKEVVFCDFGGKIGILFKQVSVFLDLKRTLQLNDEAKKIMQIPKVMANFIVYYTIEKNLETKVNFGVDCHFKSAYKADAYDIVLQQYFVQNVFESYSYPIIDLFVNFRISQFCMFVRWGHINEYWPKPVGYFSAPYYPGNSMSLDIGVEWLLFE